VTTGIKIVCISDTHGQHAKLQMPEGDILIHAGDFMSSGETITEISAFNSWIGRQPHAYKVAIAGNHDCLFETNSGISRMLITNAIHLICVEELETRTDSGFSTYIPCFKNKRLLGLRNCYDWSDGSAEALTTRAHLINV
jgi:predicted phosphodiesterase